MAWPSSPNVWPTKDTVEQWIDKLRKSGDLDVASVDAYYAQFDGAQADPANRGGWASIMPNLNFKEDEKAALVAFLNYSSQINTQGWPPVPNANPTVVDKVQKDLWRAFPGFQPPVVPMPTSKP